MYGLSPRQVWHKIGKSCIIQKQWTINMHKDNSMNRTSNVRQANLVPHPIAWHCHLANITVWSRSHCPSILTFYDDSCNSFVVGTRCTDPVPKFPTWFQIRVITTQFSTVIVQNTSSFDLYLHLFTTLNSIVAHIHKLRRSITRTAVVSETTNIS